MDIKHLVVCCISVLILSAGRALAAPITGPITDPANGYQFYLLASDNWTDSEAEAVAMGGTLATISSAAEDQWVLNTFGNYGGIERCLWIGFYDPSQDQEGGSHASNFLWISGAPITYTNWNAGEPNGGGSGGEYWTEMYPYNDPGGAAFVPGAWNDVPNVSYPYSYSDNYGPIYGVVEVVPEPASVGVVGFALMLFKPRPQRSDFAKR